MVDALDALAATQHGVVSRAQLLAAGIRRDAIGRRLRRGRLQRVHAGVYRVGPIAAPLWREAAAVLACGGVVSHRSAAAMWRIAEASGDVVDVTGARHHHGSRRPGLRVHRSRLASDEIAAIDGVPVTSVARTLVDLAAIASSRELERALAAAERERLCSPADIGALLDRYRFRRGSRHLRSLLDTGTTPAFTRSEAEERLLGLLRSGGLPEPRMNVRLHGHDVDCYWPHARLVVEVDGFAWHGSAHAFRRDRRRDSALAAAGIHVLRLSWQQITDGRDRTLVELALALARAKGPTG